MVNIKVMITGVILTIIAIVVVFNIVGGTSTTLTTAADNISGSGLPLATLFQSTGVVLLIFMAGILLAVIGLVMKMGGN